MLVSVVALQQQSPGTLNCGPLSIAAAYHTAAGDDVGSLTFNGTIDIREEDGLETSIHFNSKASVKGSSWWYGAF